MNKTKVHKAVSFKVTFDYIQGRDAASVYIYGEVKTRLCSNGYVVTSPKDIIYACWKEYRVAMIMIPSLELQCHELEPGLSYTAKNDQGNIQSIQTHVDGKLAVMGEWNNTKMGINWKRERSLTHVDKTCCYGIVERHRNRNINWKQEKGNSIIAFSHVDRRLVVMR